MDCPSVPAFLTSLYHAAWRDLRTDGRDDFLRVMAAYTETFSDTALGRGGMAGQAVTSCLTVVVADHANAAVYRNGRLDYITPVSQKLFDHIRDLSLPPYTERATMAGPAEEAAE